MKKFIGIIASILFFTIVFMLMFTFSMGNDIRLFIVGFPVITAIYFIIAGNIFYNCFNLKRLHLWLSMNFIGGLCSCVILLIRFPSLLYNGFILIIIGLLIAVFAVVWLVVGLGFLCIKGFNKSEACLDGIDSSISSKGNKTRTLAKKSKSLLLSGSTLLLILAVFSIFMNVKNFYSIRPANEYEDVGIHTFAPYDILPIQVKNNATGRYQRNNPTKTVYMVYYQTTDGTGYRWQTEGGSARVLAEDIYSQGAVERRVLSIPKDDIYITIEADQTADSYTSGLRQRYVLIIGLSAIYVVVYIIVWIALWNINKKRKKGEV